MDSISRCLSKFSSAFVFLNTFELATTLPFIILGSTSQSFFSASMEKKKISIDGTQIETFHIYFEYLPRIKSWKFGSGSSRCNSIALYKASICTLCASAS